MPVQTGMLGVPVLLIMMRKGPGILESIWKFSEWHLKLCRDQREKSSTHINSSPGETVYRKYSTYVSYFPPC